MVSEARRPYPLFNTTFTLHRLSPLYTNRSNPLDVASLQHYAHLFRDLLAGDVLRGVRVGLGANEDVLARVGALQTVSWRLLPEEELWNADEQTQLESTTTSSTSSSRGVLISVTYEKAAYMAILLAEKDRIESSTDGKEGFQSFPLLLTRMPGSLRDRFTEFLASTFDTRVSALYLGRSYMTMALEDYISNSAMEEGGEPLDQPQISRTLRSIIKELQVVIGFDLPGGSPSLRTIDIVIAREDFPRLVQSGQRIAKQTRYVFSVHTTSYQHVSQLVRCSFECISSDVAEW